MQGRKISKGQYQFGIYTVRKRGAGWTASVEDGRGFAYEPTTYPTLDAAHRALTGEPLHIR
jgi:hypothetical protein